MDQRRQIAVSPRIELFFAVEACLADAPGDGPAGVLRWRDQARRRLDHGFRRRLGPPLQRPGFWKGLAALPLPRHAAIAAEVDVVLDALSAFDGTAALHGAGMAEVIDTLRRFDRLAFAALWRWLRDDLAAAAESAGPTLKSVEWRSLGRTLGLDLPEPAEAVFVPSVLAPPGFMAEAPGGVVCIPFRPERVRAVAAPVAFASSAQEDGDPALFFQALGDTTRYAIAALIAQAPMTGAELARRLGTSTPTITHHLRWLRRVGLVREQAQGNRILLSLDRASLEHASAAAVARLCDAPAAGLRRSRRSAIRNPASSTPARRR